MEPTAVRLSVSELTHSPILAAHPPRWASQYRTLIHWRGGCKMRCPKCETEFEYQISFDQGNHGEHICSSCGQLLQWDYPIQTKKGHIYTGPPQLCRHPELRKDEARLPLP